MDLARWHLHAGDACAFRAASGANDYRKSVLHVEWKHGHRDLRHSSAPPLPPLQLDQLQQCHQAGIILTWTTSTTLNGTYAIDDRTMARLNSIWTVVLANGAFPNNKTRQPWKLMDGTQVTFSSTQFKPFGTPYPTTLPPWMRRRQRRRAAAIRPGLPAQSR